MSEAGSIYVIEGIFSAGTTKETGTNDFTVFSVFTSHVIKTKNRNHSIYKVKNLEYDR